MHKIFSDVRQYASTSCHFEGNAKSDVSSHFVVTGNFFKEQQNDEQNCVAERSRNLDIFLARRF